MQMMLCDLYSTLHYSHDLLSNNYKLKQLHSTMTYICKK